MLGQYLYEQIKKTCCLQNTLSCLALSYVVLWCVFFVLSCIFLFFLLLSCRMFVFFVLFFLVLNLSDLVLRRVALSCLGLCLWMLSFLSAMREKQRQKTKAKVMSCLVLILVYRLCLPIFLVL